MSSELSRQDQELALARDRVMAAAEALEETWSDWIPKWASGFTVAEMLESARDPSDLRKLAHALILYIGTEAVRASRRDGLAGLGAVRCPACGAQVDRTEFHADVGRQPCPACAVALDVFWEPARLESLQVASNGGG